MAFNGKYTVEELNQWKELSNKVAWALGTTLGIRYSDAVHDVSAQGLRQAARDLAKIALTAAETKQFWQGPVRSERIARA